MLIPLARGGLLLESALSLGLCYQPTGISGPAGDLACRHALEKIDFTPFPHIPQAAERRKRVGLVDFESQGLSLKVCVHFYSTVRKFNKNHNQPPRPLPPTPSLIPSPSFCPSLAHWRPLQGGGPGPGGRRPPGAAALLPLPGPVSPQLRPERGGARPAPARRPALRRLRLLAARQRDLAAAAEGPQHGEGGFKYDERMNE